MTGSLFRRRVRRSAIRERQSATERSLTLTSAAKASDQKEGYRRAEALRRPKAELQIPFGDLRAGSLVGRDDSLFWGWQVYFGWGGRSFLVGMASLFRCWSGMLRRCLQLNL